MKNTSKILTNTSSLFGVRCAILGSGESGMGAALLAVNKGCDVFLSDARSISTENIKCLEENKISYEQNGHSLDKLIELNFIVKSPGIPDDAQIILDLKAKNIPVISEIEFAAKHTKAKIIAITGSNGKTTTTLLTYHLLKNAGLNVGVAGNIGNSLSKLVMEDNHDIIVVELSSFQLDGMYEFKADTSVLLNITADHLDRYQYDINKYADSKLRVIQNQDESGLLIFNSDDDLINDKLSSVVTSFARLNISIKEKIDNGAYLSNDKMIFNYQRAGSIDIKNFPLIGKHNCYNMMAASLVALRYDVDFETIQNGLMSFKNAPHRLEYVADIDGVKFINDTKATNIDSVYYALDGMDRGIVWIAGGLNKGNDYDVIRPLVKQKVKALVCLGLDNKHLLDAFNDDIEIIKETDNTKDAVEQSFALANPGDVVLLSPACASFDIFKNYEARGDEFKEAVLSLETIDVRL